MATITFEISEQQAAVLTARAQEQGLSLEDWFRRLAERESPSMSMAHLQKTSPEQWRRIFEEFVASRDPNTPVLSDEAMNRESIYQDPN